MNKETTLKDIEQVQIEQLAEWKELLKEEVYIALEIRSKRDNHLANTPFALFRGTSMSSFVQNFLMFKRTDRLEKELGIRGYEEFIRRTTKVTNEEVSIVELKTVLEHLNSITDSLIRERALTNLKECNKHKKTITIGDAIGSAFVWSDTEEGHEYWGNVFDNWGGDFNNM